MANLFSVVYVLHNFVGFKFYNWLESTEISFELYTGDSILVSR